MVKVVEVEVPNDSFFNHETCGLMFTIQAFRFHSIKEISHGRVVIRISKAGTGA